MARQLSTCLIRIISTVVLTELVMPPVDGLTVLKRAKEVQPETMVIILTGYLMTDAAVEAFRMGADDYLIKPFELEELNFRIRKCIEKLEFRRQARISETARLTSEAEFRALVESSSDHIFMLELDGTYRFSNNRISNGNHSCRKNTCRSQSEGCLSAAGHPPVQKKTGKCHPQRQTSDVSTHPARV